MHEGKERVDEGAEIDDDSVQCFDCAEMLDLNSTDEFKTFVWRPTKMSVNICLALWDSCWSLHGPRPTCFALPEECAF
jgi:hypothetical protein